MRPILVHRPDDASHSARAAPLWSAFTRLTQFSFPRRFPIVQFPNLPLAAALVAGEAGNLVRGSAHSYAVSVSYLALAIWAYEELVHGVNWFRHLLGLAFTVILVVRVAHACMADLPDVAPNANPCWLTNVIAPSTLPPSTWRTTTS